MAARVCRTCDGGGKSARMSSSGPWLNSTRVRIADGIRPSKIEVELAIKAFDRFFDNAQQVVAAGFDVRG